jgi:hypothetical protein
VAPAGYTDTAPSLDPAVAQVFLPIALNEAEALRRSSQEVGRQLEVERVMLICEPTIVDGSTVRFVDRKRRMKRSAAQGSAGPSSSRLGRHGLALGRGATAERKRANGH